MQAEQVWEINKSISIIPDFVSHEYETPKHIVVPQDGYTIVWEGYSENVLHFDVIIQALNDLSKLFPVTVKVITNRTINRYFKYAGPVSAYLARIPCKTEFVEWKAETVATHLAQGNIGIVPINMRNLFAAAKPANKINIMRLFGLPVVASPTQAHCEAIADGTDGYLASNTTVWVEKITKLFNNRQHAVQIGKVGQLKAQNLTSPTLIASKWIQVFDNIFQT
jgi:glycosyltransferase involved in cell wall biosynthesis